MGRNSIPKLGEWNDGNLYQFHDADGQPITDANNGKMIIYEVLRQSGMRAGTAGTLAAVYADGLQEVMAAMFAAGFRRGEAAGKRAARVEIRRAMALD